MKSILLEIHSILAALSMHPSIYSEEMCNRVNHLLESIYKFSEKKGK